MCLVNGGWCVLYLCGEWCVVCVLNGMWCVVCVCGEWYTVVNGVCVGVQYVLYVFVW